MNVVTYQERHIGPNAGATEEMLRTIGVATLDELIQRTVPKGIRSAKPLDVGPAMAELEFLEHMRDLGLGNKRFRSYIGLGFHGTVVPQPILRNVMENPGWYTAYTPYQAEIAQGRLEALLNFQTMCSDLTGLPIANASLLDEATAIAVAMHMLYAARPKELANAHRFFADKGLFPQNIDVLRTRCAPIGVELVVGDASTFDPADGYFGLALQYPATDGSVNDHRAIVAKAKAAGVKTAVCADLLSLVLLAPPGEWGADVC
ncbi:MAG: glycine dehydrogenase (aminomethyl-transferring), partial [Flavobacteriales bacterium]